MTELRPSPSTAHNLRTMARTFLVKRSTTFTAGIITGLMALLSLFDINLAPEMQQALTGVANSLVILISLLL